MKTLKSINIRLFKKLVNLELDLTDVNVLIGANNSGKSSVLHALHFAVSIAQTAKLLERVNWATDKYQLTFAPTSLLYAPSSEVMSLATGGELVEDANRKIEITLTATSGEKCTISVRRGRNGNIQVSIEGKKLGERIQDLSSPFTVYAPGLAGIAREESYISMGKLRRIVARGDANLVIRNILAEINKQTKNWNVFLEDIRTIFPEIDFEIRFKPEIDETITVNFQIDSNSPMLPLDNAGTAILQCIQIIGYAVLFKPKVIILDEPDSHLHPNNQRRLCQLIKYLSQKRSLQLVLSTHSRHVYNDIQDKNTSIFWINNGQVVPSDKQDPIELLLDLGALDSIDYFISGRKKCIVLTEDTGTKYLETILESNGFNMEETEVLPFHGCTKLESAKLLASFIIGKSRHTQVMIHIDRDYREQADMDKYIREINSERIHCFITDKTDIEHYFANLDHLHDCHPSLTKKQISKTIQSAIKDSREESLKKMINQRTEIAHKLRKGTVNHGKIAMECGKEFDAAPDKYTHGKILLGNLISLLQKELKSNPSIVRTSPFLKMAALTNLQSQIWTTKPKTTKKKAR